MLVPTLCTLPTVSLFPKLARYILDIALNFELTLMLYMVLQLASSPSFEITFLTFNLRMAPVLVPLLVVLIEATEIANCAVKHCATFLSMCKLQMIPQLTRCGHFNGADVTHTTRSLFY